MTIPKKCPRCGHDMITTLDSEYVFVKGYSKPVEIEYLTHHCPNCMELLEEAIDSEIIRKIRAMALKKPFIFR